MFRHRTKCEPYLIVERTSVKKRGEIRENVFVIIHLPRVFDKDKLKSVSLQNLNNHLILLLF